MTGGRRGEAETLVYNKDGEEIWVCARLDAFRDQKGKVRHIFALLEDITESKQLRSLQQLIMSALADEVAVTEIADRLCRRVEEIAPDVVCSLLHVDSAGLIHPLGGPSLPEDYSRALDGVAIGPDVGSCGTAAFSASRSGRPISTPIRSGSPTRRMPLGWPARLLVDPDQGQGWPRHRHLCLLFPRAARAEHWHRRIVDACVHLCALAIERRKRAPRSRAWRISTCSPACRTARSCAN